MLFANQYQKDKYIVLNDSPPELLAFNVSHSEAITTLLQQTSMAEATRLVNTPDTSPEGVARYRSAFAAAMSAEVQRAGLSIEELTSQIMNVQETAETAGERSLGLEKALQQLKERAAGKDREERIQKEVARRLRGIMEIENLTPEQAREQFGFATRRLVEGLI